MQLDLMEGQDHEDVDDGSRSAGVVRVTMENDVVPVTGAGSGIGRGEARAFYEAGARVVLADVDLPAVTAVAEELGENALAIRLDVTDKAEWTSALAVVEERWVGGHGPREQRRHLPWRAVDRAGRRGLAAHF
ncbi:SDR family NAD(P)-dependent oxidoreductase [Streptomyces sp. NPDC005486]|uniref:SDR family oxidoreductase n=1 Tax=Streptomyces sp. NPDC005486 TaxID=3155345 RepID=UPI0033B5F9B9